uniref:acyloxyacyl hydrolase-like n=1 Tax=Styela clava TaxID=7725 RepID=UPI00193A9D2C|nr:acyloxyacyl hydrolase-like [Styela clava]
MNITQKEKFKNFKMYYIDFDIHAIINMWETQGGEAWEVIEPVDGFHPGQISQALSAEYMWNQMQTKYPEILGAPNPNNDKIRTIFGDQGGH